MPMFSVFLSGVTLTMQAVLQISAGVPYPAPNSTSKQRYCRVWISSVKWWYCNKNNSVYDSLKYLLIWNQNKQKMSLREIYLCVHTCTLHTHAYRPTSIAKICYLHFNITDFTNWIWLVHQLLSIWTWCHTTEWFSCTEI